MGSRPLAPILTVYVVLALSYSLATPPFEAPDEVWHVGYVAYVRTQGRLPALDAPHADIVRQEATQPPLYYIALSVVTSGIDLSDFPLVARLNPHAAPGLPHADGNKNMTVPVVAPFPWTGTILAVYLMRCTSIALGLITLWTAWRAAMAVNTGWPWFPPAVVGLIAFNPQFLFISAAVNNDNMVTALGALAFLGAMRVIQGDRGRSALGLLVGAAAVAPLAKVSGLVILGLTVPIVLWTARRSSWAQTAGWLIALAVGAGIISGWWYARNVALYGDILGLRPMVAIMGERMLTLPALVAEWQGLLLSFWGVFGWMNVLAPEWYYTIVQVGLAAATLGLGLFAMRGLWRCDAPPRAGFLMCLLWAMAWIVALIRWTSMTPATQGRLLFPAVIPIAVLLIIGWTAWLPHRLVAPVIWGLVVGLGVFATLMPVMVIRPAYAPPQPLTTLPTMAHPVSMTLGNEIELVGYTVRPDRVVPGGTVDITLLWRALAQPQADYSVFIHLYGRQGEHLGQRDSYPGRGLRPTSQWQRGDIYLDSYRITIPVTATAPAAIRLEAGLYRVETGDRLSARDPQGRPLGQPLIGRFKLATPRTSNGEETGLVEFGHRIALLRHDVPATIVVSPSSVLTITTVWRAIAPMDADYTMFLHLGSEDQPPLAQADGEPLAGDLPTSLWEGEAITDVRHLTIPSTIPPGSYRLTVGFYNWESGQRLTVPGTIDQAYPLSTVTVR